MSSPYQLTVNDLPLPERARKVLDVLVQEARARIAGGDEQEQRILVCNSEHEKALFVPCDVHALHDDSQRAKTMLAADVRRQAVTMEADMVIMLAEGWQPPENVTVDEWSALKAQYGSIAAMPGAKETLVVRVETPQGVFAAVPVISGKGSTRRVAPALFAQMDAAHLEREKQATFSQLLPTPEQVAIVNETLGRAERIFLAHGINPHKQVSRFTLLGSLELMLWSMPGYRPADSALETVIRGLAQEVPGL